MNFYKKEKIMNKAYFMKKLFKITEYSYCKNESVSDCCVNGLFKKYEKSEKQTVIE